MNARTFFLLVSVGLAAPLAAQVSIEAGGLSGHEASLDCGGPCATRRLGSAFGGSLGLRWQASQRVQVRADVSALSWNAAYSDTFVLGFADSGAFVRRDVQTASVTEKYSLVPVFVGARASFGSSRLQPYLEGGATLNFMDYSYEANSQGPSLRVTSGSTATKPGAALGVGLEPGPSRRIRLGLGVRYYLVPRASQSDPRVNNLGDVSRPGFLSARVALVLRLGDRK